MPDVNIWAVLLATLSTMVVGSIWYTPKVFGNRWMELAKVDQAKAAAAGAAPIIVTVVVSLITAFVLAGVVTVVDEFRGGGFLANALLTGVALWAGFTAARIITHDAFEGRPTALTTMNIAHELVTIAVMSLIIGLFGAPGA